MYSRIPDEAVVNYDLLKEALLKRYDLITDEYHDRFCKSRPQLYENVEQFVTRQKSYLDKWILLSHTEESATGIKELFIRQQFIKACPKDLAIDLRERELPDLRELTQAAGRFVTANNRNFYSAIRCANLPRHQEQSITTTSNLAEVQKAAIQCFVCKKFGHRASEFRSRVKTRCYVCDKVVTKK